MTSEEHKAARLEISRLQALYTPVRSAQEQKEYDLLSGRDRWLCDMAINITVIAQHEDLRLAIAKISF